MAGIAILQSAKSPATSVIQPQNLGERWVGLTRNPLVGRRHVLLVKLVHS